MDKENTVHVHIYYEILFGLKKGNFAICNMDEPKRHYAKWNKLDTERQIQQDLTYMYNPKTVKFIIVESNGGGWGVGDMGRSWSKGTKFQL